MSPTHLVLRRISIAAGQDLYSGDRVDASGWANRAIFESEGYIRRLREHELAEPAVVAGDVDELSATVAAGATAVTAPEMIQVDVVGLVSKGVAEVRVRVDPAALAALETAPPAVPKPAKKKPAKKKTS